MLVLSRKIGERIVIGDDIVIQFVGPGRDGIRIGVEAPKDVRVDREEIAIARRERAEAGQAGGPS